MWKWLLTTMDLAMAEDRVVIKWQIQKTDTSQLIFNSLTILESSTALPACLTLSDILPTTFLGMWLKICARFLYILKYWPIANKNLPFNKLPHCFTTWAHVPFHLHAQHYPSWEYVLLASGWIWNVNMFARGSEDESYKEKLTDTQIHVTQSNK